MERRAWGGEGDSSLPCILGGTGWEVSRLAGGSAEAAAALSTGSVGTVHPHPARPTPGAACVAAPRGANTHAAPLQVGC